MEIGYHDDGFAIVTGNDVEIHLWAACDESWKHRSAGDSPVVTGAETFLAGTRGCRLEMGQSAMPGEPG